MGLKVTIKNLNKNYGKREILNIDKLEFNAGAITAMWGSNGAGKSTLLKIIAGLDNEFNGYVHYNNTLFNDKIKKDITMVFQKPYMLRGTVYRNLVYPLKLRKLSSKLQKEKVYDIAEKLGIGHLVPRNANKLSGGETQKVALARAMIFEPKLLLLDEATSGVDVNTITKIEEALVAFNKETGATIIFSTHSREQAKRLGSYIVGLYEGRVENQVDFFENSDT